MRQDPNGGPVGAATGLAVPPAPPVTRPEASGAAAVAALRESDLSHVTEGRGLSATREWLGGPYRADTR